MTVKLNCSSSGSVALSAPASTALGADVVLNLPSHAGSLDRLERAGNILQVVNAQTTTSVSNTNTTYVDTTLSASITPTSASSKILVLINQSYYANGNTYAYNGLKVFRGAQEIYVSKEGAAPGTVGSYDFGVSAGGASSIGLYEKANITLLDSPNTTSATTYKTQGRSYGVSTVKYQISGSGSSGFSTITLMEVAA